LEVEGVEIPYERFQDDIRRNVAASHMYIVFGEGGTGKTTFLRRLALDLSLSEQRVYRATLGTLLRPSQIIADVKLHADVSTFLIVDDAHAVGKQLLDLNEELLLFPNKTVLVAASRRNEWNMAVRSARPSHFTSVQLALLSHAETQSLLDNLERAGSLGHLASLSAATRIDTLMVGARRQLLAGLLEATHGAGFREIVINEYESIAHEHAQFLYVASCVLQSIGVMLPISGAQSIALTPERLTFEREIITRLELVVQLETADIGMVVTPRHRIIANELLAHVCPTGAQQFDVALRSLQRLRRAGQAKVLQLLATRIGARMLARDLIATEDDAHATAEAVVGAGTKNYRLGMEVSQHALAPQIITHSARGMRMYQVPYDHPDEKQFLVAARILRVRVDIDASVRVLSEGLSVNEDWHLLTLALAQCRVDEGDLEAAESLVARVLAASKASRSGPVRLTVPLAMGLMRFRRTENPRLALDYLELADGACFNGMSDSEGYFVVRGRLLVTLGDTHAALRVLKRGLAMVVAPAFKVKELERRYAVLLASYDEEEFCRWTNRRYPEGQALPGFVVKLLAARVVAKRDEVSLSALVARHSDPGNLIGQLTMTCLHSGDLDGIRFLCETCLCSMNHGAKILCAFFTPAILQRDPDEFHSILSRVANRAATARALLKHWTYERDAAAFEFVYEMCDSIR
jgi:hypothetical protein